MQKYNGRVIYQNHDDDGILEVVEADGVRSLHFGTDSRQSSMLIDNQDYLHLSYSRAMMTWNLFREDFATALMIGLGGGSLVKYLLQQFPDGHITVVEQRKSVVKIARSYFHLPFDDRLKIVTGDGGSFIRKIAETRRKRYDLLLIDAFSHEAVASSINGAAFFDACRALLTEQGVMVINLWNTDRLLFDHIMLSLNLSFGDQLLSLPVRKRGNVIVFCFPGKLPHIPFKTLQSTARQMEAISGIEYPLFLKDLKRNNPQLINRIGR